MTSVISPPQGTLVQVDEVLSDGKVLDAVKAFLLLRVCQFSQVFRPEIYERYLPQLQKLSPGLSLEQRTDYNGLMGVRPATSNVKLGKFTQSIVDAIEKAGKEVKTNPQEARRIFADCRERLQKRHWPWGKKLAWHALVPAWAELDRGEAFQLLNKLPVATQKNLLIRLHDQSPLTPEEWDLARKHGGPFSGTFLTLGELLDREKPKLQLNERMCRDLAQSILPEVHRAAVTADAERKAETDREKALKRYLRLVTCADRLSADLAESLMESLVQETIRAKRFEEKWAERITYLRELIAVWMEFPSQREKALSFLKKGTPNHLRDFCLAQWYGTAASTPEEAREACVKLEKDCKDTATSEAWFLVTLIRRGLGETAVELANSSPRSAELLPRIRRAWMFLCPEKMSSVVRSEDLTGDVVGQFLLISSLEEQVAFLREKTRNGSDSLPQAMWASTGFTDLADILVPGMRTTGDPYKKVRMSMYSKTEAAENRFKEYLRMHGYGEYNYDHLDPFLLKVLTAWEEAHPDEVKSLLATMWNIIKPATAELRFDLLRNAIFERCYTLFSARPESLKNLFVSWVKRELVDKTVQDQVGNTIYSFRLNDCAPFLYCLLGAQKVARHSPRKCDEILTFAINLYSTTEDLMNSTAQLFASDKGLSALQPPAQLNNRSQTKAWQLGVAEVSLKKIYTELLEGSPVMNEIRDMAVTAS